MVDIRSNVADALALRASTDLVVALGENVPEQNRLNERLNEFKDLEEGPERLALANEIRRALDEFEERGATAHSNPPWLRVVMRACVLATLEPEHLEEVLRLDHQSQELARTPRERAISWGNASETLRCLNRPTQAIAAALNAVQQDPNNDGLFAYLALALLAEGSQASLSAAAEIFRGVQLSGPRAAIWRGYLLSYEEFQNGREQIPELDTLLTKVEQR